MAATTNDWIDATATLDPATTPVYEGDAPMKFEFLKDMRKGDALTLSAYSLGAHSGTHIDAPMHFVAGGASIDRVPLAPLIGPARVIDIPDSVQAIDAAELNRHQWRGAQRVIFRTRSSRRGWMRSPRFHRDFAHIAPDAAQLLADAGVQLVGIDYLSAEQFGAPAPTTHRILLGKGIPIVEGLALDAVGAGEYDMIVLPMKVAGHEGAPARAVLRKRIAPQNARELPERLSNRAFWALASNISEPGGYFRIEDNFTSNEMEVGQIFTMLRMLRMLRDRRISSDVYLGVGPEQNFTYIAAIRPKMAFIIDIRRQAVMQHLMYKAMFELAADRADFISILFAKPRPSGLDAGTSIQRIWEAFRTVASDSVMASRNYARVVQRLTGTRGFSFTEQEWGQLKAVFQAFYYYGPSITTRGAPSGRGGDFAALTGFSNDMSGAPRSFLSSEDNYRYVQSLHERNLIVPVSGDFAGPKALRAIAEYLETHNAVVRAFYVSNVEQYLFGDGKDAAFYANVATLPIDTASVFVRPHSLRRGFRGTVGIDDRPTESLCPIGLFLRAVEAGRVLNNFDALSCPR
jgi:arylformamidase